LAGGSCEPEVDWAEDEVLCRRVVLRPLLKVSTLYKPVPGMPVETVRRPFELMVYLAPVTPKDIPTESLLKLRRTPGINFMDLRKRILMVLVYAA
jgi:hypothetical protein